MRLPIGPNPDGSGGPAARWLQLRPGVRAKAVALVLTAAAERVDLGELVTIRSDLRDLAAVLNLALRASGGLAHDHFALAEIIARLDRLFGRTR